MFPVTVTGDANHCLTVSTTAIKGIIHAAFRYGHGRWAAGRVREGGIGR